MPNNDTNSKPTLIYYFDALCGWCYGFSEVMRQIQNEYADLVEIEVISGGLFVGERTGPINEVAPYIKAGAYKTVEQSTGVKFGEAFLANMNGKGNIELNSVLPSLALCVVKDQLQKQQYSFAASLLHMICFNGHSSDNLVTITDIAQGIGLDKDAFISSLQDPMYLKALESDYTRFHTSKYSAMPSLVIEHQGIEHPISRGYTAYDQVKARLDQVLQISV